MVDAEQVMLDDPFDQVEQTEADQERGVDPMIRGLQNFPGRGAWWGDAKRQ
jgi:hypothetical protein